MNRIIQGDNLVVLQEMPDNSIDLIATDPPFNTGKDWGAFNDKWEGGLKGYLKFMEPRCVEMHRVLKETGSFYLHCDPTASHYLKVMLDGVFGIKQFRNEIVWHYPNKLRNSKSRTWVRATDNIFYYTKGNDYAFHTQYQKLEDAKRYCKFTTIDGKKTNLKDAFGKNVYIHVDKKIVDNVWRFGMLTNDIDYPTQKPIALYQRIIKASSNEGDTVLDPFAGSGTTLDAAQSLNRRWIGIDQNPDAIEIIEKRLTEQHALFMETGVDYEVIR